MAHAISPESTGFVNQAYFDLNNTRFRTLLDTTMIYMKSPVLNTGYIISKEYYVDRVVEESICCEFHDIIFVVGIAF